MNTTIVVRPHKPLVLINHEGTLCTCHVDRTGRHVDFRPCCVVPFWGTREFEILSSVRGVTERLAPPVPAKLEVKELPSTRKFRKEIQETLTGECLGVTLKSERQRSEVVPSPEELTDYERFKERAQEMRALLEDIISHPEQHLDLLADLHITHREQGRLGSPSPNRRHAVIIRLSERLMSLLSGGDKRLENTAINGIGYTRPLDRLLEAKGF